MSTKDNRVRQTASWVSLIDRRRVELKDYVDLEGVDYEEGISRLQAVFFTDICDESGNTAGMSVGMTPQEVEALLDKRIQQVA